MTRKYYKCTLHTDIIMSSSPATEGFHASLDYIPGAKFLGIVAGQLYDESSQCIDLFHNGTVCFGDAHPWIQSQRALKIPFAWHYDKLKPYGAPYYVYYNLSATDKSYIAQARKQLKQARGSYIIAQAENDRICTYSDAQKFTIKSAYNREERRAKNGQMYGYFGLPKGTIWSFYIDFKNDQYISEVETALIGIRHLGRSKAAEYGVVEIEAMESINSTASFDLQENRLYIYAASNLCFYDDFGRCTTVPKPKQLGLPDKAKIDWLHSQIRTRPYRTWNQKRQNRDGDRMIIEKGSVLVIDTSEVTGKIDLSALPSRVGSHQSEGFGELLFNPIFLKTKPIPPTVKIIKNGKEEEIQLSQKSELAFDIRKFQKGELTKLGQRYVKEKDEKKDGLILNYLSKTKRNQKETFDLDAMVNIFVQDNSARYKAITPSQWGQIRRYAKFAKNNDALNKMLFHEKEGLLHRGQSESIWRKKARRDTLKAAIFGSNIDTQHRLGFAMKLASEMGKQT